MLNMLTNSWFNQPTVPSLFNLFDTEIKYPSNLFSNLPYDLVVDKESKSLLIFIACAGYTKDDLEIKASGKNLLHVKFNKPIPLYNEEEFEIFKKGISSREISTALSIPSMYDTSKTKCQLEDGLLKIEIPHLTEKNIDIKNISIKSK